MCRFEEATHRTTRWLDRCIAAHSRPTEQNLFAIVQGGLDPRLRDISLKASYPTTRPLEFAICPAACLPPPPLCSPGLPILSLYIPSLPNWRLRAARLKSYAWPECACAMCGMCGAPPLRPTPGTRAVCGLFSLSCKPSWQQAIQNNFSS